jgi:serine/threonine protein kinase/tetratricopeptide (TPR) repeat protein
MPDQRIDEKEVFNRARQIAVPEERLAYLQKACEHESAAMHRVLQLLRVYDQERSFLESSPVGHRTTIDEPLAERPGTMIGPYKLLEQIGEGGFGVVFLAEQTEPVRRKVALKILKPGMDTRQIVARFEAERQALAIMDHPNIAKVLDGGQTASGRPYFVMELVKGLPITDYCDLAQLTTRERLELFVHLCQAVEHAHQKGIIHRDLKPSNVLVMVHDTTPVAKVIDFGVAKALGQELTDKTLFTGFAQLVGTPLYMSPEQTGQSGVDVDTRSDIYALGVLLYELLTGTTPFDKERLKAVGYDELRRIIREEEPPRPSTRISTLGTAATTVSTQRKSDPKRLSRLFRGEPDWIVMKCLEKDRNRRYETASALSADVQRYLHDEPVQACPPSAVYCFRKFARRKKTALAIASMALSFMAMVGGGGGWLMRDRAARQWEADSKVLAALEAAEPRLREGQPKDPALLAADQRMRAALESDRLSPEIRQSAEQLRRDVRMLGELDEIRLRQAESNGGEMFDSAGAEKQYADAFTAYGIELAAMEPSQAAARVRASAIREALLEGLDAWMLLTPKEDQPHAWLAAVADEADDSPWRRTFRKAALAADTRRLKELAGRAETLAQPPSVLAWLGSALHAAGLPEDAAAILRQAQQRYPGDFWLNYDLGHFLSFGPLPHQPDKYLGYFRAAVAIRPQSAEARSILGLALLSTGETDEAITALQQAIALAPRFATARINLGTALTKKGQPDDAIAAWREAVRVAPGFHEAHIILADALNAKGRRDEAITEYEETLRLEKDFAQSHAYHYRLPTQRADYDRHQKNFAQARGKLSSALKDRGVAYNNAGQFDQAIADLSKAIALDPKNMSAWCERALSHIWLGQYDIAVAECSKAIELDANFWWVWDVRGLSYNALHRYDEALADLNRAVELEPKNPRARSDRASIYLSLQRYGEALADCSQASELDPKNHLTLNNAAWCLVNCPDQKIRDWNQAVILAKKAVELAPAVGDYWNTLGAALYRAGRWKEAVAALEKSIQSRNGGDSLDWFFLAMAHYQLGDKEQARKWFTPAVLWLHKHQPTNTELGRFHAEAAALLGLAEQPPPTQKQSQTDDVEIYDLVVKEAISGNPDQVIVHYWHALVRLGAGDRTGYRRACAAMLERFAQKDPPKVAQRWVAWTCVLSQDSGVKPGRVVELAEQLATQNAKNRTEQTKLGAALYRAGRFEEAVRQLDKAEALPANRTQAWEYTWFFLAMAHQHLGHAEDARHWLEKAQKQMERTNSADLPWNRRLTLQLLRREAEVLLGSKDEPIPHQNTKEDKTSS